jgi:hypothetical protein
MIWEQIDVVVAVACFAGLALFMIRNDTPSNWWGPMSHSPNRAERELVERMRALGLRSDVDEKAGADQPAADAGSDTRH